MSGTEHPGPVEVVAAITEALRMTTSPPSALRWVVGARVVRVDARVPAERALVGCRLRVSFIGTLLPGLVLRPGILCVVGVPLALAEQALDEIAEERRDPLDGEPLAFSTQVVRPLAEPCVRVPLSLLRELRGQEATTENVRRALVHVWSEDRRTGSAADG